MQSGTLNRALTQSALFGVIWVGILYAITPDFLWGEWLWINATKNLAIIFIVILLNTSLLLPKFYFKRKFLVYVLLIGCLFLLLIMFFDLISLNDVRPRRPFDDPEIRKLMVERLGGRMKGGFENMASRGQEFSRYFRSFPAFILAIFVSTTAELTRYASTKEKENTALEKEKLITEIKFLKAQINPHFLFNALNNIYTLILTKSEDASQNLLRLSDMLKYMVYDCSAKRVPLSKELDYLRNYIALSSLKDRNGLNISVDLGRNNPELMVPPLLFIPFVENAFKHSNVEDVDRGWIEIKLESSNNSLNFHVKNSYFGSQGRKDSVGGVGLENVRKRLQLIYGSDFTLKAEIEGDKYIALLKIEEI